MRRILVLSIATGAAMLVVPTAMAGTLPGVGTWVYDGTTKNVPSFKIYVAVNPAGTPSVIYSLQGSAWGKCKSKGKSSANFVDFNVNTALNIMIPIKPNGTFSTKWIKTEGDAAGERGKAKIRGTFNGTTVKGTVTARQHGGAWGKCSASKKKFKAKGVQVG